MKIQSWFLAVGGGIALISVARAGVIFSQDFSSAPNGPVSTYLGSPPNNTQFDTINWSGTGMSGGIVNGALQYTRSAGGFGWFARNTDFSPTPNAVIYSFDLGVTGNNFAQSSAATWQIGSGFSTASGAEQLNLVNSRFGIELTATAGTYRFLTMAGGSSADVSGPKTITWVINNSGAALTYLAPDNSQHSVDNNSWDLWANTDPVFQNVAATTPGRSLTDIKFAYDKGYATIRMDNFSIRTVQPVPEPGATGVVAVAFLIVVACGGTIRAKSVAVLRAWHSHRISWRQ